MIAMTQRMRDILTNPKAQDMIDYVSPVYGESYTGLWIFQAIGSVMGEVCGIAEQLACETNTTTTDLLLDYWEDHYAVPRDRNLTKEQRRLRLVAKAGTGGPCNPVRLAAAVSGSLGGVQVDITENYAKNTFRVNIRDENDEIEDWAPAIAVIERMKQAHTIYVLNYWISFYADMQALHRMDVIRVSMHMGIDFWRGVLLDGEYLLDGSIYLDSIRARFEVGTKHHIQIETDESCESNEVIIKQNMWYLDGEYLLDGSKRLNACQWEEEL